jgi:predicted peptidase
MGGAGAWATAMEYPERFAAVAPLAGRAIPLLGGKLWKTPIWVFHGNRDEVVPFTQSKEMVDMLKGMGNDKLKFTVLEGAGHAIENDIYNRAELYDWFMQHRRGN